MDSKTKDLHVVFLPFMAAGHMIPMLDIAKLFAARHVKTTIITTPLNAPIFLKPLENYTNPNYPPIDVKIIPFPSKEANFPEGIENIEHFTTSPKDMKTFLLGCQKLEEPVEKVLEELNPNCLIADFIFIFATRIAARHNIPRLVFQGISFFSKCVHYSLSNSYTSFLDSDEEFIIPTLPHEIKMKRSQIPVEAVKHLMQFNIMAFEAASRSYGVIVNSFYDLEADYVNHYRNVLGGRAWDIGPVSLCNRKNETKFKRGKESSIEEHECLKWLDSKNPNSVVYMCFGSLSIFSTSQLGEIMAALEALGVDFIWVVGKIRKDKEDKENEEDIVNGFEKRMERKGLIIRGWAPQILILEHESVGAFVTHCGWNSILEAISCGVPMVTWPVFGEQPMTEKLVTQILNIGVSVGAAHSNITMEGDVGCKRIKDAIGRVIIGEDALEYRRRMCQLKEMAKRAVEDGGSSYSQLTSLIHELSSYNKS